MTTEKSDQIVMPETGRPRSTRFILFAGVAGACVLGVSAGMWARPAMSERQSVAAAHRVEPAAAPAPARQLQIVVDDRITPAVAPPVALPRQDAAPPKASPPAAATLPPEEEQVPKRAPQGLMHILGPALLLGAEKLAHPHFASPPSVAESDSEPPPAPKHVVAKAAAPHGPSAEAIHLAKAQVDAERQARLDARLEAQIAARNEAKAEKARLARAQAAQHQAQIEAQIEAQAEAKAAAHRIELAKAAAHRTELAHQAKAKGEQVRLAKAEDRGRALALAEAREEVRQEKLARADRANKEQLRLASLVRAMVRDMQHKARPEPAPAPVVTARLEHRHGHKLAHDLRVQQAAVHKPRAAARLTQASHPVHPRTEVTPPQSHPSGLMRVSTHCASRDPGEAIVCANPNLGAADRQMSRAYQGARAAGVPDAELRQQQQRWVAARSNAAREAPWAVRDVYLARIAELNGQAREARPDGN